MQHLSSRLRRLHSGGPAFVYSIAHPSNRKFSYGSTFLVLETENNQGVEIRDVESQKILHQLNLQECLSERSHGTIANIRIQENILTVSIVDKHDEEKCKVYSAVNFIFFFSLTHDFAKLLLKVPRVLQEVSCEIENGDAWYAFNEQIAVICTIGAGPQPHNISIWSLDTGELMMSNILLGPITSIAVGKGNMWSILRESEPRIGAPFDTLKRYKILEFNGIRPSCTKARVVLPSFPNDRKWNEWHSSAPGLMDFQAFKGACWGIVWRQPIQDGWKVKSFSFRERNTNPTSAWNVLSSCQSCFGQRIYVNFESEYIVIPHEDVCTHGAAKPSYISLRRTGWGNINGIPTGTVQEHWVECDASCKRSFFANDKPQTSCYNKRPQRRPLDVYGDDEFILFRSGGKISVYKFDV